MRKSLSQDFQGHSCDWLIETRSCNVNIVSNTKKDKLHLNQPQINDMMTWYEQINQLRKNIPFSFQRIADYERSRDSNMNYWSKHLYAFDFEPCVNFCRLHLADDNLVTGVSWAEQAAVKTVSYEIHSPPVHAHLVSRQQVTLTFKAIKMFCKMYFVSTKAIALATLPIYLRRSLQFHWSKSPHLPQMRVSVVRMATTITENLAVINSRVIETYQVDAMW